MDSGPVRRGICLAALLAASLCQQAAAAAPAEPRASALLQLLHNDCGACHGLSLKGGLGSPLTPQALAGKPADSLVATILNGRPGTPMPPWRPFLSEEEAQWLVQLLQQGGAR
ncbi:cytochrome C55X precursor NirC [Aquitalea sp. FJL05]|uniref:c-type cytochrome n=1 Tax=Aquitalea TaxID=407217 RepID=UPI000F5ADCC2|nr:MULTISPECIES: cytochrome c [Aquitalea]RQO73217.1 cytochrome C55X precursor NirC [Aquitalea sp. FJL05]